MWINRTIDLSIDEFPAFSIFRIKQSPLQIVYNRPRDLNNFQYI